MRDRRPSRSFGVRGLALAAAGAVALGLATIQPSTAALGRTAHPATAAGAPGLQSATTPASSARGPLGPDQLGHQLTPAIGSFQAVAEVAADDVWAVGNQTNGGVTTPLAEHWDGEAWHRVSVPVPDGTSASFLQSVAAVDSSDVWAVGYEVLTKTRAEMTLTEHWDGQQWQVVASPSEGGNYNMLMGVTALSADDVWAVGTGQTGAIALTTQILHWNGTDWQIVNSPNVPGTNADQLNQVAAVGPDDIWAVGYAAVLDRQYSTLVEHWDGTAWKIVSTPGLYSPNYDLQGVSVVGADNIWAVGYRYGVNRQQWRTLTEHWNGRRWKVVRSANAGPGSIATFLFTVATFGTHRAWTDGWYQDQSNNVKPFVARWNGRRWRRVDTPDVAYAGLFGLAGSSADEVWAVGGAEPGLTDQIVEHWDGTAWQVVSTE